MAKTKAKTHEFPAKFQSLSISGENLRLGIKIDRDHITNDQADEVMVDAQCEVDIIYDPNNAKDSVGQTTFEDSAITISGLANIGSHHRYGDTISASVVFATSTVEASELAKLTKKAGTIKIKKIGISKVNTSEESAEEAA